MSRRTRITHRPLLLLLLRAEDSNTHRHLCEFTGLDFEMCIHEHYEEVLEIIDKLFIYIFEGLNHKFGATPSICCDMVASSLTSSFTYKYR